MATRRRKYMLFYGGEKTPPSIIPGVKGIVDIWIGKEKSNADEDRAQWVGLENGHVINLYNYLYSGKSGWGSTLRGSGNVRSPLPSQVISKTVITPEKAVFKNVSGGDIQFSFFVDIVERKDAIVRLTSDRNIDLSNLSFEELSSSIKHPITIIDESTFILPFSKFTGNEQPAYALLDFSSYYSADAELTFEFLTDDGEGALVSNGIDNYGMVEGLPILEDYTVFCLRDLKSDLNDGLSHCVLSKYDGFAEKQQGAFNFEQSRAGLSAREAVSFDGYTDNLPVPQGLALTHQSKNSYNGVEIASGNGKDTGLMFLASNGRWQDNSIQGYCDVYTYAIVLVDHTCTEDEVQSVFDYIKSEYPDKL